MKSILVQSSIAASVTALCFIGVSLEPAEAASLDIGPETTSFTGSTRGYWFTAPTNFTITGLKVPTTVSTAPQSIEVLGLNVTPPDFASSTQDFQSLGYWSAINSLGFISTNISVQAGDIIGILGSRGSDSANSYGAGNYSTLIGGLPVTLRRLLMQDGLESNQAATVGVSTESGGSIGRIELEYSLDPAEPVPTPALLPGLIGMGVAALSKRKQEVEAEV